MRFEIARGRKKTAHTVLSWFALAFFGAAALSGSIRGQEDAWLRWHTHLSSLSSMPEGDLANLWAAGHLARLGHLDWLYSSHSFFAWKQAQFGTASKIEDWIYPPTVLLIGVPLSFLPLFSAFLVWDAGSLFVAIFLLRWSRLSWPVLLVGLLAPASWRSLELGQWGIITGAMVIAGLLAATRHPVRAGILLGLVTLKPQQGIIVPIAWLAAGFWRAIALASITFGLLALAVILWLGPHAWSLFFTNSSAMARELLNAPPGQAYMSTGISVFWMCRTMGATVALAYQGQILATLIAVILTYLAWRKPDANRLARVAFTACASLLVTPYGYNFDLIGFSIAIAIIVSNNGWRVRLVDVFLWLWPFYSTAITVRSGVLLTPVVIASAAALAWRQMSRSTLADGFVSLELQAKKLPG